MENEKDKSSSSRYDLRANRKREYNEDKSSPSPSSLDTNSPDDVKYDCFALEEIIYVKRKKNDNAESDSSNVSVVSGLGMKTSVVEMSIASAPTSENNQISVEESLQTTAAPSTLPAEQKAQDSIASSSSDNLIEEVSGNNDHQIVQSDQQSEQNANVSSSSDFSVNEEDENINQNIDKKIDLIHIKAEAKKKRIDVKLALAKQEAEAKKEQIDVEMALAETLAKQMAEAAFKKIDIERKAQIKQLELKRKKHIQ